MKKFLKVLTSMAILFISMPSYSLMPVVDWAAIAQLGEQLSEMEQQTKYIESELEKLKSGQYQWSNAQSLINNLGSIVSQTNGISYNANNIDSQFKKNYPGYQPPENYSQQYKDNANRSINTMNGVLQSMGSSAADFQNENSRLKFLQQQSESAEGQTQAIQASSQIASETVTQLQLLRQTVIAQTNAETVYYATQTQNNVSAQAELQKVVSAGSTMIPAYGSSGHPLNPPS